jgi:hypothetical protein
MLPDLILHQDLWSLKAVTLMVKSSNYYLPLRYLTVSRFIGCKVERFQTNAMLLLDLQFVWASVLASTSMVRYQIFTLSKQRRQEDLYGYAI